MRRALLPVYLSMLILLASGCTKDLETYRLSQNDTYMSRNGKLVVYKGNEGIRLSDGRYFRINSDRVSLDSNLSVAGDETAEPLGRGQVYQFENGYKLEVVDTKTPKAKVTKKLGFWGAVRDILVP